MHREKRLGLAMGVLIIAIVGAFFFRVKPTSHDQIPELAKQENIENMISEMPAGPYIAGIEEDHSPIKSEVEKHRFSQNMPEWNDVSMQGNLQEIVNNDQNHLTPAPNPILSSDKTKAFSVSHRRVVPKENDTTGKANDEDEFNLPEIDLSAKQDRNQDNFAEPGTTFDVDEKVKPTPPAVSLRARPYRVKQGDTLFQLAQKYLGDKDRYQEIYRLNQKKLHSPNDLRVGMLIRLPMKPRVAARQKLDLFEEVKTKEAQKKDYHLTIENEEKSKSISGHIPAVNPSASTERTNAPLRQWPFKTE